MLSIIPEPSPAVVELGLASATQRSPKDWFKVLITGLDRYLSTVFEPVLISTMLVMPG